MILQEVIVHTLNIKRIGERALFQVRLPRDTRRIIGFEYAVRKTGGMRQVIISRHGFNGSLPTGLSRLRRGVPQDLSYGCLSNKSIGRLSLGNSGCENLFYQGDLVENRNTGQYEGIAAQAFLPQEWMQSTKREEISLSVQGGLIEGSFQDCFGQDEYFWLLYELNLYLWIEKCIA